MSTTKKLLQSSGLLVGIRLFQRSLGLISTLILARLLTPEDFGVVAVAALIIHFSEVLSNTGIQQYIVQVEEANVETVNTAWTLDLMVVSFVIGSLVHILTFQKSFLSLVLNGIVFILCYGSVMFTLTYFLSKRSSTWGYVYEYGLKLFSQVGNKIRTH